jgi:hypothetical protein
MAPNNIQVTMVTAPAAPLSRPIIELEKRMMAEEIPEAAMRSPAKIKAGIAKKVNIFKALKVPCGTVTRFPPAYIMVIIEAIPIEKGIGTRIRASNRNIAKNIARYIMTQRLLFLFGLFPFLFPWH